MQLSKTFDLLKVQSDKGTTHDYINGYYDAEFSPRQNDAIQLLEIGIHKGASMELWSHFFPNGGIIGLDNEDLGYEPSLGQNHNKRWIIVRICDAYADEWVNRFANDRFDWIIDDGPHTVESQLLAIKKYLPKVKPGGKLIIEDIQSELNLLELVGAADETGMEYNVFDLRKNKGRYDDIILEIIKK